MGASRSERFKRYTRRFNIRLFLTVLGWGQIPDNYSPTLRAAKTYINLMLTFFECLFIQQLICLFLLQIDYTSMSTGKY